MQTKRHAVSGRERCDVDDAAAAGPAQCGDDGFAAVPDAFDVHNHCGIPVVLADRIETATPQTTKQSGIVDERVDAAEGVERRLRRRHRRRGAGDVELRRHCHAPFGLDQAQRICAVIDVGNHHAGAAAAEITGIFLPDPARCPGDDNNLSFDFHVDLLGIMSVAVHEIASALERAANRVCAPARCDLRDVINLFPGSLVREIKCGGEIADVSAYARERLQAKSARDEL